MYRVKNLLKVFDPIHATTNKLLPAPKYRIKVTESALSIKLTPIT